MIRRLTFDGSPTHALYFRLLFLDAFRSRGSAPPEKRVTKAERRTDATILRAMKAISNPVGDEPTSDGVDMRERRLKVGGGILELEQPAFKQLQGYLDDTQWTALAAEVAADLEDWVDAAEKVEETRERRD